MGALLLALVPLLTGITQPLKDWFGYKQKEAETKQQLALATLQAQAEQAKASMESDTAQLQSKLAATTSQFKEHTFYFLLIPLLFSILLPSKAAVMWHNFDVIPEWFRTLFGAVYLTIWGIPVASSYIGGIFKGMGNAVSTALADRREYKIDKIKAINENKLFDSLRKSVFTKGFTQDQVVAIQAAIKAGQEE